jgi:hypothetical protein
VPALAKVDQSGLGSVAQLTADQLVRTLHRRRLQYRAAFAHCVLLPEGQTAPVPVAPSIAVDDPRPAELAVIRRSPLTADPCPLTLRLTSATGGELIGRGVVPRPSRGFVSAVVGLRRGTGIGTDAVVRLDVRALEPEQLDGHPDEPPADWDEKAQLDFARRFGRALGVAFAEMFPRSLAANLRPDP